MKQTLGLTPGITKVAGAIGAVLVIAGGVVAVRLPEQVWTASLLLAVALLHLAVFFVGHLETMKGFSARRSTRLGADSFLMAGLFIAILVLLNFIAARHFMRWDLSSAETFTLAPQTVKILKSLKGDLRLLAFFPEKSNAGIAARDLLENYRVQSRKVTVEMIDPDKKPEIARQYKVTENETVVVVSGGRTVAAKTADEPEITAAIIRASRDAKTVYFVEGHGEHSIGDEERSGYAMIAASMTQQGLAVKTVTLLAEKRVPDDAAVLIIAGPKRPFAPEERSALSDFLARGGQLFALLDPAISTDLPPLFAEWGVALPDDQVVDPTSGLGGGVPIVSPGSYPDHEITRKFDLATFYPLARSVAASEAAGFDFEPILKTGKGSWKTDQMESEITLDPERDQRGPITIGAVSRKMSDAAATGADSEHPARSGANKARLVVIGDSDFATNNVVHAAGNGDLFQNVVRWLTDDTDLIAIQPKAVKTTTLLISAQEAGAFFMTSVLLLPIATLTSGWIVWRRRRRL